MAAANPDYHFTGVDFNPEHIAHARSLAGRTGLKNIDFFEGDFIAMADADLPWQSCDYVVAHGILSWVNFDVRHALFRIVDKSLVPGGLAYFSYNALPGWLATHPVQHIMRQYADRTGVNAISFESALNTLQALKDNNAAVFKSQPGLTSRLEQLQKHPKDQVNYMYHEYFNGAWSLFYSTQVADEAAVGKLRFLGSATIPENYDTMLPENMRKVLDSAPDPAMRELFKDMLTNQTFRRDVFVRGVTPVWSGEQLDLFVKRMVTLIQAPDKIDLKIKTGFGDVSGKEEVYKPLIFEIAKGPIKIADLHKALPDLPVRSLLQSLGLLIHAGAVSCYVPDVDHGPAMAFNRVIAEAVSRGAPYRYIALPGIGSGMGLDEIQWMAIDAHNKGEDLASGVGARLKGLNKSIMKDGQPLPFGEATAQALEKRLEPFIKEVLPRLKMLGGVK